LYEISYSSPHFKYSSQFGVVIVISVGLILSILKELPTNVVELPARSVAIILINAVSVLYQAGIVHKYEPSFSVHVEILYVSEKSHRLEYCICSGLDQ